jgi:hypothetical protein
MEPVLEERTALSAIMPTVCVDKQTGTTAAIKKSWITGARLGSKMLFEGAVGANGKLSTAESRLEPTVRLELTTC